MMNIFTEQFYLLRRIKNKTHNSPHCPLCSEQDFEIYDTEHKNYIRIVCKKCGLELKMVRAGIDV